MLEQKHWSLKEKWSLNKGVGPSAKCSIEHVDVYARIHWRGQARHVGDVRKYDRTPYGRYGQLANQHVRLASETTKEIEIRRRQTEATTAWRALCTDEHPGFDTVYDLLGEFPCMVSGLALTECIYTLHPG